jgi:indole-3-glycerol phosphate synthase
MSLLEDILASKRSEVEALRARPRARSTRVPLDVPRALRRPAGAALRLIAEVKLRSPSAGPLSAALAPAARAVVYAEAGATMVSVLCDGPFFGGSWEDVAAARDRMDNAGRAVPLLAKDFVVDERQIAEARDRGADAILLIARILDGAALARLSRATRDEGLEPVVEVVDEREIDAALAAEARVVGVNARDLDTLAMDPVRAERICAAVPEGVVTVHFSGLRSADDVRRIAGSRADAALVGEALMRDDDPGPRLRELVRAANSPAARVRS